MSDVTLGAATRNQLLSLQSTLGLLNRTNNRLATGQAVNSPQDNAVAFFSAQSLNQRVTDLSARKATIDQNVSLLTATQNGLDAVQATLNQIAGLITQAQSASTSLAGSIATELDTLFGQINNTINDTTYQGQNLLNSSTITVTIQFSTASTSTLQITSRNLQALSAGANAGAGLFSFVLSIGGGVTFSQISGSTDTLSNLALPSNVGSSFYQQALTVVNNAIGLVQQEGAVFGGNNTFLQTRLNFTSSYASTLTVGAGKLTLADINQEGANAVALQTRQQLGIQALAFTGQSDRSVLQLFR